MSNEDLRHARQLMDLRVAEEHRRANGRQLQRLARAGQGADSVSVGHRLLRHSGLLLVALGGRLVRLGLPQYRAAAMELGQRSRN